LYKRTVRAATPRAVAAFLLAAVAEELQPPRERWIGLKSLYLLEARLERKEGARGAEGKKEKKGQSKRLDAMKIKKPPPALPP
jgi:hypothetical protein